jgi:hypothetical protein
MTAVELDRFTAIRYDVFLIIGNISPTDNSKLTETAK